MGSYTEGGEMGSYTVTKLGKWGATLRVGKWDVTLKGGREFASSSRF